MFCTIFTKLSKRRYDFSFLFLLHLPAHAKLIATATLPLPLQSAAAAYSVIHSASLLSLLLTVGSLRARTAPV
ncbi:hypothetical protein LJC08_02565 [Methanimicrococcus sp. OttesenSCG-928-J09]|nr:hypothetical protein [Methanimicrococcus sp. OttesenSCG-928-J09]